MILLKTLKFVRGAVATKDFVPEMKHFVIEAGRIRSFNGVIALSSPIDFAIDCKPKAVPLVHAIANCEDNISMDMTSSNKLSIRSGGFKVLIECVEGEMPHQEPEGEMVEIDGEIFLNAFKTLRKFIGSDAARAWSNGILLRGQSAFATNNVCLVEYWVGLQLPFTINVPTKAVDEVLRIDEPPVAIQLSDHSITFHYSDERWIRSQLLATEWPDLSKILNQESSPRPIPEELFKGLDTLKPFTGEMNYIYFIGDVIATDPDYNTEGAAFYVPGLGAEGTYKIDFLRLLDGIATQADFTRFPKPTLFFGERLRGAIMGFRA